MGRSPYVEVGVGRSVTEQVPDRKCRQRKMPVSPLSDSLSDSGNFGFLSKLLFVLEPCQMSPCASVMATASSCVYALQYQFCRILHFDHVLIIGPSLPVLFLMNEK